MSFSGKTDTCKEPEYVCSFNKDGLEFEHYNYGSNAKNNFFITRPSQNDNNPNANKAIIWIHGGGFHEGDAFADFDMPVYKKFHNMGYTVATVNYRLIRENPFSVVMQDIADGVTAACNLLRKEGKEEIKLSGHSAGSTAGALLLYSPEYPSVPKIDKFIGTGGLYSPTAMNWEYLDKWIKKYSVNHDETYSGYLKFGKTPKTKTPALLLEGKDDCLDVKPADSSEKSGNYLTNILRNAGVEVNHIYTEEQYGDHNGPKTALEEGCFDDII